MVDTIIMLLFTPLVAIWLLVYVGALVMDVYNAGAYDRAVKRRNKLDGLQDGS